MPTRTCRCWTSPCLAGGACRAVPALPGFNPGPAHAVYAYEATEAHGVVWVRLEESDA